MARRKAAEVVVEQEQEKKGVVVAATIPTDLHDFIEDIRWDLRMKKSEVVAQAVQEWAEKNGFNPDAYPEVEDADADDE